jgi:hypothetical protein
LPKSTIQPETDVPGWLILPLLFAVLVVLRVVGRRTKRGSTSAVGVVRASRIVGVALVAVFVFGVAWGVHLLAQMDAMRR